jgi:hypothetical protein
VISDVRSDQALATGRLRPGLGADVAVVTKRKLNGASDRIIARSREAIVYLSGSNGYALLDYDSKDMPAEVRARLGAVDGLLGRAGHGAARARRRRQSR